MPASPLVLPPCLPTELLTYILSEEAHPTTLIICCSRSAFLSALLAELPAPSAPEVGAEAGPDLQPAADAPNLEPLNDTRDFPNQRSSAPPQPHPLLQSTLHQLRIARHITTAFVPTITHLRAYLSIFPTPPTRSTTSTTTTAGTAPPDPAVSTSTSHAPASAQQHHQQPVWDKPGTQRPKIVVYGLLALHRFTSEWSAQGIGSMLAALVEAGARTQRRVVLIEPEGAAEEEEEEEQEREEEEEKEKEGDAESEHEEDENVGVGDRADTGEHLAGEGKGEGDRGGKEGAEDEMEGGEAAFVDAAEKVDKLWQQRLPLLSGSIRRKLGRAEGASWVGRTVEVGVVVNRWFRYARADFWEEAGYR